MFWNKTRGKVREGGAEEGREALVDPEDLPAEGGPVAERVVESDAGAESQEDELRERIIDTLKTCYDPEIPVDIYELGLIYDIRISPEKLVEIEMTLTSPMCPVAESLPPEVEEKVRSVPGVVDAKVQVVWDPPWSMDMMSEAARLELGFF